MAKSPPEPALSASARIHKTSPNLGGTMAKSILPPVFSAFACIYKTYFFKILELQVPGDQPGQPGERSSAELEPRVGEHVRSSYTPYKISPFDPQTSRFFKT